MKVKQVMSAHDLDSCAPDTDLSSAAKQMKKNNRGVLPVVNRNNRVIGMITDRDICLALAERPFSEAGRISVSDVMNKDSLHTVKAEDDIAVALREMRKYRVNRLPVTNGKGELSGILSIDSLLLQAISNNRELGSPRARKESLARTLTSIFQRNATTADRKGSYLPATATAGGETSPV